ncbi:hypothetical protein ABW20_dc0106568 [Dactylellina cionopaga]|nr:hypothetical protein ABW20_dc0106568 [Dactylellina cionopaga]
MSSSSMEDDASTDDRCSVLTITAEEYKEREDSKDWEVESGTSSDQRYQYSDSATSPSERRSSVPESSQAETGEVAAGETGSDNGSGSFSWETLTNLANRLEAATSRLEDIVTFESQSLGQAPAAIATAVASNAASATAAADRAAATTPTPPAPPAPEPLPPSIQDFDELGRQVTEFEALSAEIDPLLAEQAKLVGKGFLAQRLFLLVSIKSKKPDIASKEFLDLIKDMQSYMSFVNEHRDTNRSSPLLNHLSMVSEAVPALAWVTLDTKPAEFVSEMANAGQFYGNRVIKEYKEKDKAGRKHIDWVRSWYSICKSLEEYVRKYHLRGISWNREGGDALEIMANLKSSASAAPPSAAPTPPGSVLPPPPPPPGPPPPPFIEEPKKESGSDMGAVFAQLNQGSNVTSGLRKVEKSEMTHKNPSLRASSQVPEVPIARSKSPGPQAKPKPAHMKQKKPPRMELDGGKWIIENYDTEEPVILENVERNHSVFVYRCKNTTIQIKGKLNAISMNECEKTNVVLENLVSGVDVIKSKKFAFQILGTVPTITVDQCDGGTLYVSKESLGIEVYTSKTTAFNIYVPGEKEDDDYVECPIPEQIKSSIKGQGLVSEIVEHAG